MSQFSIILLSIAIVIAVALIFGRDEIEPVEEKPKTTKKKRDKWEALYDDPIFDCIKECVGGLGEPSKKRRRRR